MVVLPREDELVSLFVVSRHSIRAPIYYPEGDPFISGTKFPRGASYLTDVGIKRSVAVGKIWRKWYPTLITGNVREVWARSSESYRCVETAQALLHGMYKLKDNYQPIPITVPPPDQDKYVSINSFSKQELGNFLQGFHDYIVQAETDKVLTVRKVLEYVEAQLGLKKKARDFDMFVYLDGLISLAYDKLSQPGWYLSNRKVIDYTYDIMFARASVLMRPYFGHYLMEGLANRMMTVKDGKASYGEKFNLFSYHDMSVLAVLNGLDERLSNSKVRFLSSIFFEMYKRKNGTYYFKIFWSEGLRSTGSYNERKALSLSWANNTNKVEFDRLYERLSNNIYKEYMLSPQGALKGYTQPDAMV